MKTQKTNKNGFTLQNVELSLAATVVTGTALLMALCMLLVWPLSGWNAWRKVHFSLFALAYTALGLSFINWGLLPFLA